MTCFSICQFGDIRQLHGVVISTLSSLQSIKGRRKVSAALSLFSYRKFSELQFMLRPVNSRENPDFCH